MKQLDSCIWVDPGRQSGQACFGGTRIPVDPFMAIVEEAGPEAAQAFWPEVTAEHIAAGRLWRERYSGAEVVADLRDRVAELEAELQLYRPREVVITMPPRMPSLEWPMRVTCGYGVDSNLATSGY